MDNSCKIIAEAGVNHNGDVGLAKQLIDVAAESGADIVKFQTFQSDQLTRSDTPKAAYQIKQTGDASQMEMLRKLELPLESYADLFNYAKEKGIKCISTAFDVNSLNFLVDLGMDMIKIPSGEITNAPLLFAMAQKKLPMILSTGMATLQEIEAALSVLAFGFLSPSAPSSFDEVTAHWEKLPKDNEFFKKVVVLHCTTNYPAAIDEINLNAMIAIGEKLGFPIGYSDHSAGIMVPIVAAAMGATIIEKHITLDKNMPGPDHAASLNPSELNEMVKSIREVSQIRGSTEKLPSSEEIKNKPIVRRGVYKAEDVSDTKSLTESDLLVLRPENQFSPMQYWDFLGKKASDIFKE